MHLGTILSAFFLLLTYVFSQDNNNRTCWGVDGQPWEGNRKCPGSSACYGPDAECMPSRLGQRKGQAKNMFVRGPCAAAPWDMKECAVICVTDKNKRCCAEGRGYFLDDEGNLALGNSTESETTTSSLPTTTSVEAISTSTQSSDNSTETEEDDGQAMKIGLGVGIPAGIAIVAVAAWLFLRKRNKNKRAQIPHIATAEMYGRNDHKMSMPMSPQGLEGYASTSEMYQKRGKVSSAPQELEG
ncbi:uncharacterized protein FIESC28_03969 [Fusarium coffeatum]|uniref:Mid2 domain-containing protein n=1 Tax=Fusarium coffeatum TaxID=231269 RepID=A0A366S1L4_9HYPO|nr:uncharacterized protein FIESC28_03969 [Fusarium coffeatum]RBR23227.1 hypothetical protein FIESC28_03969 [Fusarium coffeatum]